MNFFCILMILAAFSFQAHAGIQGYSTPGAQKAVNVGYVECIKNFGADVCSRPKAYFKCLTGKEAYRNKKTTCEATCSPKCDHLLGYARESCHASCTSGCSQKQVFTYNGGELGLHKYIPVNLPDGNNSVISCQSDRDFVKDKWPVKSKADTDQWCFDLSAQGLTNPGEVFAFNVKYATGRFMGKAQCLGTDGSSAPQIRF